MRQLCAFCIKNGRIHKIASYPATFVHRKTGDYSIKRQEKLKGRMIIPNKICTA